MAWSTPRTWVAGAVATAAQLNQEIRDNLNAMFPLGAPAWTSYTPTLTQSATVTKTTVYAKYTQVGKNVSGKFDLVATGAGTGANAVLVGVPVTAVVTSVNDIAGEGFIFDASGAIKYRGILVFNSSTTVKLLTLHSTADGYLGATDFTAALANNDIVSGSFFYEAA